MEKTAVEWLIKELINIKAFNNDVELSFTTLDHLEFKAKEMERKQHQKTWDIALDKYEVRAGNYMRAYEDFDDYYEQFKK